VLRADIDHQPPVQALGEVGEDFQNDLSPDAMRPPQFPHNQKFGFRASRRG
jgi:hypothetical protein